MADLIASSGDPKVTFEHAPSATNWIRIRALSDVELAVERYIPALSIWGSQLRIKDDLTTSFAPMRITAASPYLESNAPVTTTYRHLWLYAQDDGAYIRLMVDVADPDTGAVHAESLYEYPSS